MSMSNPRAALVVAAVGILVFCPPVAGMSQNVAIVDSPYVINGGTLPTSGGAFSAFTFTNLPVASITLANLQAYDTVVLNVASPGVGCNVNNLTAQQKADLVAFVGQGHKMIIFDSECAPQNYSWMPYPFTTANPGALGAHGTLTILEDNYLSHNDSTDPHYIDAVHLGNATDAVGDMNVMTTFDPNWCIDLTGTNAIQVSGPVQTYAAYPPNDPNAGLFIYNGLDLDYMPSDTWLNKLWQFELEQPFAPNVNLPCLFTPVGISLSPSIAVNDVGTEHTVTALVADLLGVPQPGVLVTFEVFAGPNAGTSGVCGPNTDCTTDVDGVTTFTYLGSGGVGADSIRACFLDEMQTEICSATAVKEWVAPQYLEVDLDITPPVCPNPLPVASDDRLRAAILGTATFDVMTIDPATVALEGVPALYTRPDDVAEPVPGTPEECECWEGNDAYRDLVFAVPIPDLVAVLGPVSDKEMVPLTATGMLYDGTPFQAVDCVLILKHEEAVAPELALRVSGSVGAAYATHRIDYSLPTSERVDLAVYDVTGRQVDRLVSTVQSAGDHSAVWDARGRPSGVYFVRLVAGARAVHAKVIVVR